MKLRMVPYGYRMNNGKIIPDKNEATVVRNIFDLYIGGKSLKAIADSLTAENVPIFEGNTIWSKNRIKRILEDERYIGTNSYPPILSDDLFVRAKKVSEEKSFTVEPCSPLLKAELENIKETLSDTGVCFSQYDDVMIRRLVGLIRVMKDRSIVIFLKGGLSITEVVE